MKKRINSYISFILCFLLIFISGCTGFNLPFTTNKAINVADELLKTSNITDKHLGNKIFSIKAGEPVGTSITISKSYVLSSKTIRVWQPTDYDISNQTPDKVKVTAVTNKSDVSGGATFVIDGVTKFSVPSPCNSGNYPIGITNSLITVTDIDSTHKQFEFIWDGKNVDGTLVKEGVYTIHVLKTGSPAQTKTLGLDIEVSVTTDPLFAASMTFFQPRDFKDLLAKLKDISNIPEDTADALFDKAKEIQVLNVELLSLKSRVPQDLTKISDVQQKITDANNSKALLITNLSNQLNQLDNQKSLLRTYLNTISSNSTLSVDYPITDKPTDINNYIILSNHYYGDFGVSLSSSQVSLYQKDPSDTSPDDFKQKWQTSSDRVEKIDLRSFFKGANAFLNEIQTAKNLLLDYNNGVLIANDLRNEETLSGLISQIKQNQGILKTRSLILYNNYQKAYNSIRKSAIDLHNNLLLPLALTMNQISDFKNNTYVLSAINFNINLLDDADAYTLQAYIDTLVGTLQTYISASPLIKEKAISLWIGKTKNQLDEMKANDAKYGTHLVQSLIDETDAIVNAHIQSLTVAPRVIYETFAPQNVEEMGVFTTMLEADLYTGGTAIIPSIGIYLSAKLGLNFFAQKITINKILLSSSVSALAKKALNFSKKIATREAEGVKYTERISPKIFNSIDCFRAGYHINGIDDCLYALGQTLIKLKPAKYLKKVYYNQGAIITSRKILVEGSGAPLTSEQLIKLEQIVISDKVNGTNYFNILLRDNPAKPQIDYSLSKFAGLNQIKDLKGQIKPIGEILLEPIIPSSITPGTGERFLLDEIINIFRNLILRGGVQIKRYGLKDALGNFLPDIEFFMPDFESLVTTNPSTGRSIFTVPITGMTGEAGGFGDKLISSIPSPDFVKLVQGIGNYLRSKGYTITDEEVRAFVKSLCTGHHNNITDMLLFPNKLHTGKLQHPGGNIYLEKIDLIYDDSMLREIINDTKADFKTLFTQRWSEKP